MENNLTNKIALTQLNLIPADINYNKNKVIECIKNNKDKAGLIIFSELTLLAKPFFDVLEKYPYIEQQIQNALDEIKMHCDNIAILIGGIEKNNIENEKPFFSTYTLIKNQKIEKTFYKSNLANDELKYFQAKKSENVFELNNIKYEIVFDLIPKHKADVFILPNTTTTKPNKQKILDEHFKKIAFENNAKLIFINQTGANDEFIYDGLSRIYNQNGELCEILKEFDEDIKVIDLNNLKAINYNFSIIKKEFDLDYSFDLKRIYNALICSIQNYFTKNNLKKAVLGLSGGLDSTICAVLLADALGSENVYGISIPSKLTSQESKNDAKELANNLKINFDEIAIEDLQNLFAQKFDNLFSKAQDVWQKNNSSYTQDNIQARSRAMLIWGLANEFNGAIPIATSDKSEIYMGYATINGDMSGGFAPISDVTKTKLFQLATWMNENRAIKNAIPKSIIEKPPGAELAINPDTGKTLLAEEALMPYEFMDEVIWRIENHHQTIENMMNTDFIYEKKYKLLKEQKKAWLEKFFKRLKGAQFKGYLMPLGPIIDSHSISKGEFRQPITSNIDYSK